MKKLQESEKQEIISLYNSGLNCVQIKNKMALKGHQQVLNILNKYPGYIPYRNGRSKVRKYNLNESYFNKIDDEYKAYIYGFLAADGHVDDKTNRVKILVATKDVDILEKIKICLSSTTGIKNIIRGSRFSYGVRVFYHSTIEFNSKQMVNDLKIKGLISNKTYSLNRDILNCIPENLVRHFLRGYFDGDGCVFYGKEYSSGKKYNIDVVGNLDFLQNTFGKYFPTTNKYYFHKKSKQTWSYKLSSKENVDRFLKYLYDDCNIFLNRKYNIYLIACGHLKQGELLETPTLERQRDNQQPSLGSNTFEGSTTNSRLHFTVNVTDSNGNTSALPYYLDKEAYKKYTNFKNKR